MATTLAVDEETLLHAQIIKARGKMWTPALEKLLRQWRRQISTRVGGHIETARVYARRNYLVGVPSVILGAVAASTMFSSFQNCDQSLSLTVFANATSTNSTSEIFKSIDAKECTTSVVIRIVSGVIALLAAVLSGLHVFLNYSGKAEQHKNSSDAYEALTRTIDEILQSPVNIRNDPVVEIQSIRRQYDDVAKGAPSLSEKYQVDLSYAYVGAGVGALSPRTAALGGGVSSPQLLKPFIPPTPAEVEALNASRHIDTNVLKEVIVEDGKEDEQVVLPFDLDAVAPEDLTNIRSRQQLYPNLAKALQFELQRLNNHEESRYGNLFRDAKEGKKKVVDEKGEVHDTQHGDSHTRTLPVDVITEPHEVPRKVLHEAVYVDVDTSANEVASSSESITTRR